MEGFLTRPCHPGNGLEFGSQQHEWWHRDRYQQAHRCRRALAGLCFCILRRNSSHRNRPSFCCGNVIGRRQEEQEQGNRQEQFFEASPSHGIQFTSVSISKKATPTPDAKTAKEKDRRVERRRRTSTKWGQAAIDGQQRVFFLGYRCW